MTLRRIIAGSLILAGLTSLLGCPSEQEEDIGKSQRPVVETTTQRPVVETTTQRPVVETTTKPRSHGAIVEELAKNEYRVFLGDPPPTFFSATGVYSLPEDTAGVSAEVRVNASDRGKNAGIARLILYEDGREISSTEGDYLSFQVNHTVPGAHTYQAEAIDNGGNRGRSQTIDIEFSGKPMDTPPIFFPNSSFFVSEDGSLYISVWDHGDNKGIREVLLYEEGTVIRRFECNDDSFSTSIPLASINQTGRHTYQAEAIDNGGNRSKSEILTVSYGR